MPKPSHTTPVGKKTGENDTFLEENHPNIKIRDVEIQKENKNQENDDTNTTKGEGMKQKKGETEYGNERESEYLKLLVTKTHKIKDEEDHKDVELDTINHVAWIVNRWIDRGDIKGVYSFQEERLNKKEIEEWNTWLSEPKTSGKNTMRVELYFTVETKLGLRDLVNLDRAEYKHQNIWIEKKQTLDEHTSRVGYLTGPIVENANLNEYEKMMIKLGEGEKGEIEVKRNMVYEGDEKEWCVTVHSVRSAAEKINFGLRKMSAESKSHIKYVSFKNSTKADKIAGLKLNRLINVKLNYEWLNDVSVLQKAKYRGQKGSLGQMIMDVRVRGIPIFNGVEQGHGKNSHRVYMYYKPKMIDNVKHWIRTVYGKDFVVEGKGVYESSVKAINPKEEKYNSDIRDYITERIKEIQIDEKSYSYDNRSYSEVVRGVQKGENKNISKEKEMNDDETIITDNRSRQSDGSDDTITEASQETMQTKMIIEMQGMMKHM